MHSALEARPGAAPRGGDGPAPRWREIGADWDEACRRAGNPFHCGAYLSAHCGRDERPVGVVDDRTGFPLAGGILADDAAGFRTYSLMPPAGTPAIGRRLVEWLRNQGCLRFRLGSFQQGLEGQVLPEGVEAIERLEFVLELDRPEQDWWRALHSQHRRKLRRAARENFRLARIADRQAAVLARLSLSWSRRRRMSRNWLHLLRCWWQYRGLLGPLSRDGLGALYGLYGSDGELLSAAYMLETPSSAFYMIGASSEAGYAAGASFDLFWQLGRRYRDGGLRYLNLGGVPRAATETGHAEHGVYRFKRGFVSEPAVRVTWEAKES